jgi:hypothetical protein
MMGQKARELRRAIDGPVYVYDVSGIEGFHLYTDLVGSYLCVSTQGVGETTGWDHFAVVGLDLSAPVSAPWAKAGSVADRKLYLGGCGFQQWGRGPQPSPEGAPDSIDPHL